MTDFTKYTGLYYSVFACTARLGSDGLFAGARMLTQKSVVAFGKTEDIKVSICLLVRFKIESFNILQHVPICMLC